MNKKKLLIISSIVFVIAIASIFVSYGFITAEISGNESSKKTVFNGKIIKVEYSDGTETLTSNQQAFTPGSTITKTFTIKNTGNVSVKYSINLDNVTNTFTRKNDIKYELYSNDEILKNGMYEVKGIFPDNKLTILNKDVLDVNESKTYTLKIHYINSEENQIIDSGNSFSAKIVIDESKASINKLLVYGNSIQENKNLMPSSYYSKSQTTNGVTFTVNNDGSITLNGTATVGFSNFLLVSSGTPKKFKAGTYTLSGNPITSGARLWFREVNSSTNMISVYAGNSATITLTKDTDMYIYISINKDTVFNNETIYPQIELGKEATSYTSSFISPQNPVEIKSLGDKTKNLFDYTIAKRSASNITGTSYENGIWTGTGNVGLSENAHSAGALTISSTTMYPANKTYTISIPITLLEQGVYDNTLDIYIGDQVVYSKYSKKFTLSLGEEVIVKYTITPTIDIDRITIRTNNNKLKIDMSGIMIEESSTATGFEPYGKYNIPIKINDGKNLFDKNNVSKGYIDNENGEYKTTTDYRASDFIEIPLNTASLYLTRQTSGNWGAFYDENKQYIKGFTGYRAISVPSNAKYIRITVNKNYLDKMQVEVGDSETRYESYIEPTKINVFLNEPLRKVGNTSDYIDFVNRKVIRNIKVQSFKGTEDFFKHNMDGFYEIYYSGGTIENNNKNLNALSNYFKGVTRYYLYSNSGEIISSGNNYIRIHSDSLITADSTENLFKTWVKEKYDEGNPFTIHYVYPDVPDEDIEIPEIIINKGTKNIEVCSSNGVCASNIEVEYDE